MNASDWITHIGDGYRWPQVPDRHGEEPRAAWPAGAEPADPAEAQRIGDACERVVAWIAAGVVIGCVAGVLR